MERLPYIDEHAISVAANRADTWQAVLRVTCRDSRNPRPPVGFTVDSATEPDRFALKGRHPFSVYKLVFEMSDGGPGHTRLRAVTWADFPGVKGRVYRALVIGSGGHRVVVRRMLRRIAASAS